MSTIEQSILAIVTLSDQKVLGGGAPVIVASTKEEQQRTAFLLEKILDGMAHDLENGVMIIVRH